VSESWDSTPYVAAPPEVEPEAEPVELVTIEAPTGADPLDVIDDGSAAVGPGAAHEQVPSGTLAFALSSREQLAALADPEVTGDARVDAATARLGDLAELPTSDHVAVYDDVHRRLQDALADAEVR
jgi:hypothetical protein